MARINFDDDVEAQDEFWNLLTLIGGDRDRALGMLLRFFRRSQEAYGKDTPLTLEVLEAAGLIHMVASGWAVPVASGGYYAKGAGSHFEWYKQRVDAGKKRGQADRDEKGRFLPSGVQRESSEAPPTHQPLAPSLAPALSKKEEEEKEKKSEIPPIQKSHVQACCQTWIETLRHYKIDRGLNASEENEIARAVIQYGAEYVDLALYGARFEPANDTFKPKDHVSLRRVFGKDKHGHNRIEGFVNWGTQNRNAVATQRVQAAKKQETEEVEYTDPARVREILAASGFGLPKKKLEVVA